MQATCCPEKELIAKGLCKTCYQREHKRKMRQDPEKRAKLQAITKAWRRRNPEYERARSKRRYRENPDRQKELTASWWKRHPEKRKEYKKRFKEKNLEKFRAKSREYVKKRKAIKRGASISKFTNKQWEAMKEKYNFLCFYCGDKPNQLTQDHMVPLSRGGAHEEANIVPACMSCNSKKGTRTTEEYNALASAS